MDINKFLSNKYLNAEDMRGHRITVTISHVVEEVIREEDKPVVYFDKKDKGLVLNRTNATSLKEITGSSNTEEWSGQKIVLFLTKIDYWGKRVSAIRIDAPEDGVVALSVKADADPNDDIPF